MYKKSLRHVKNEAKKHTIILYSNAMHNVFSRLYSYLELFKATGVFCSTRHRLNKYSIDEKKLLSLQC